MSFEGLVEGLAVEHLCANKGYSNIISYLKESVSFGGLVEGWAVEYQSKCHLKGWWKV